MNAQPTGRDEFRRMADVALDAAGADHVFVALQDRAGGTTRFANNQVVQNVNTRRHTLTVSATFGKQSGTVGVTDVSPRNIRDAVARAERIARVSPPDPEFLPPLGPQRFQALPTVRSDTADAGPHRLISEAGEVIRLCDSENLEAAGVVSAYVTAEGLAASTGLFGYERRSRAEFSLTATGSDSTGWVRNVNRSIDDLGIRERTGIAIRKVRQSASPREIAPGRYTVILEPAAVAGLLGPLHRVMDAKSYYHGTSALNGKLGERIIDPRLTLSNDPDERRLLGDGFNRKGIPADNRAWIENGVLRVLDYDRFTAKEHGTRPSAALDAPVLSTAPPENPGSATVDDLIRSTRRGILVTNLWYIRFVNPTDLTLTGMTRDGTFLIEDGRLATGLINFRWHDSPLRAFNDVRGFTAPMDAITMERTKMLLPALKIGDFNFSSVTRF